MELKILCHEDGRMSVTLYRFETNGRMGVHLRNISKKTHADLYVPHEILPDFIEAISEKKDFRYNEIQILQNTTGMILHGQPNCAVYLSEQDRLIIADTLDDI